METLEIKTTTEKKEWNLIWSAVRGTKMFVDVKKRATKIANKHGLEINEEPAKKETFMSGDEWYTFVLSGTFTTNDVMNYLNGIDCPEIDEDKVSKIEADVRNLKETLNRAYNISLYK